DAWTLARSSRLPVTENNASVIHSMETVDNCVSIELAEHMTLTPQDEQRVAELIDACKRWQGEYRPAHHPPNSWATTYSYDFVRAAAELYVIFERAGLYPPLWELAHRLRKAGVRSCRGSTFSVSRAEYLFETHLKEEIREVKRRLRSRIRSRPKDA